MSFLPPLPNVGMSETLSISRSVELKTCLNGVRDGRRRLVVLQGHSYCMTVSDPWCQSSAIPLSSGASRLVLAYKTSVYRTGF